LAAATQSELRRFGLSVGGVFLVLGTVSWYRGHDLAPRVMWAAGVLLFVPGLVLPTALRPVHRFWMGPVLRVAMRVGEVVSRVFLSLLFFLVFVPVGFVMRHVHDPLDRDLADGRESDWHKRERVPVDPARYEQQF
jgi:Saxitoxin biosynthesis operon protein SxtJ